MDLRILGIIVILLIGVGSIGYGLTVGDEGTYYIDTEAGMSEEQFQEGEDDPEVIEYNELDPAVQEAFRNSLQKDDPVRISDPGNFTSSIVHYENKYYQTYLISADASLHTMFIYLSVGTILIIIGIIMLHFNKHH